MRRIVAFAKRLWLALLPPDDEAWCFGCFLDRQWVGSEQSDHTCRRCGRALRRPSDGGPHDRGAR